MHFLILSSKIKLPKPMKKTGDKFSKYKSDFGRLKEKYSDTDLEERMEIAQKLSSMVLAIRKKESLKVRQPLQKMMVPII